MKLETSNLKKKSNINNCQRLKTKDFKYRGLNIAIITTFFRKNVKSKVKQILKSLLHFYF